MSPGWREKALRSAQLAAFQWSWPHAAAIDVQSSIPVARGFGSSTADCVAAVRALAAMIGRVCNDSEVARIVQLAERASDSTMFGLTPVVFLPERGECHAQLGREWPELYVTAFDLGGPPTETLRCPRPRYTDEELDEFDDILGEVELALRSEDARRLARCSTRSAVIQQRYRPHPRWNELRRMCDESGSYGVAISHSGTVGALLSGHPQEIAGSICWCLSPLSRAHHR